MKINSNNNISTMGNNQQGAVLIVVLLFLILITLAGVMSVKNSNTDLRVATGDQVNTVLLQAADNVNSKLEQSVNSSSTSTAYKDMFIEGTGVMYHYIYGDNASADRTTFCFNPRQKNFTKTSAVIMRGDITLEDSGGYCDPNNSDDYTGARGITLTQVTMTQVPKDADSRAFDGEVTGKDSAFTTVGKKEFDFYSTAVLPALGSSTSAMVTACMKMADDLDTDDIDEDGDIVEINNRAILKCMDDNDIIAKQVVERVEITNETVSEDCGVSTASTLCPAPTSKP